MSMCSDTSLSERKRTFFGAAFFFGFFSTISTSSDSLVAAFLTAAFSVGHVKPFTVRARGKQRTFWLDFCFSCLALLCSSDHVSITVSLQTHSAHFEASLITWPRCLESAPPRDLLSRLNHGWITIGSTGSYHTGTVHRCMLPVSRHAELHPRTAYDSSRRQSVASSVRTLVLSLYKVRTST